MTKRVFSALLAAAIAVTLFALPAAAAQRELIKQTCEQNGGSFSSEPGVKHCTWEGRESDGGEGLWYLTGLVDFDVDLNSAFLYTAQIFRLKIYHVRIVDSQHTGNGEVVRTVEKTLLSDTIHRTCTKILVERDTGYIIEGRPEWERLDPAECEALGLYPAS